MRVSIGVIAALDVDDDGRDNSTDDAYGTDVNDDADVDALDENVLSVIVSHSVELIIEYSQIIMSYNNIENEYSGNSWHISQTNCKQHSE
jgi:hypothetical protein